MHDSNGRTKSQKIKLSGLKLPYPLLLPPAKGMIKNNSVTLPKVFPTPPKTR